MSGGISRLEGASKPEKARPQPSLPVLTSGVASNFNRGDVAKSRRGSRAKRSTARRSRQSSRLLSIGQAGPSEVHPADMSTMPGFSLFRQPETKPITQEQLISEVKARMWRHGIQSFLELLRKRLPASREQMLTFICIAYNTMTLLYETVPVFALTWIECLGDLGRYRMAIEDDDIRDREIWTAVSQHWYSQASDRSPEVGRLYHHLAILARPNTLEQLYYYNKALCVPAPFDSARQSIMTLFRPILKETTTRIDPDPFNEGFVRVHAMIVALRPSEEIDSALDKFLENLDQKIAEKNKEWLRSGYLIAISLICSLLGYGDPNNPITKELPKPKEKSPHQDETRNAAGNSVAEKTAQLQFESARPFVMKTCDIVFRRKADINALPFFHTILVSLYYIAQRPKAIAFIEKEFPWTRVVEVLNEAYPALMSKPRMASETFPRPPRNEPLRPLPEDYAMRGLALSEKYFPPDWFSSDKLEDDEKMFEPPSLGDERRQRLLWLGRRICSVGNWFEWDEGSSRFIVNPAYDRDSSLTVES
ncbi:Telomerase-binding protein EST1A [Cordyceps javanica]|uniref:Telomerase-binding protein EST1A n=1 Tax=Cordyceps javanica TaxID=43265 RepID=A0A545UKN9_9HYPO|nr:Telomerase-binding protein EST1A [Cordyceps javanica]